MTRRPCTTAPLGRRRWAMSSSGLRSRTIRSAKDPGWGDVSAPNPFSSRPPVRSEEHTSELQSRENLVCRLLLEKKKTEYSHGDMHVQQASGGYQQAA